MIPQLAPIDTHGSMVGMMSQLAPKNKRIDVMSKLKSRH